MSFWCTSAKLKSKVAVFDDKVEKSITYRMYNEVKALRAVPEVDCVAELYVTFFKADVPRTVFLLTVIRSCALLVVGIEHEPGGVREL